MCFKTFLILFSILNCYSHGKLIKIENCTSTYKSLKIERCDIANSALFVSLDIFRPLNNVFVSNLNRINEFNGPSAFCLFLKVKISLFKRESTYFKPIGKFPVFEGCDLVKKGKKQNPFVTIFTNIAFSAIPNLFKDCPITGHFEILNFTVTGEMVRFITKGVFKASFHLYNDFDEMILWVSYIFAKTSTGSP